MTPDTTSDDDRLGPLLEAPVPGISQDEVRTLARTAYGIDADVTRLSGERDRNFHLRDPAGAEYALRVINPLEDPGVSDFQSRALLHLARHAPGLPVPRLIPPLAGDSPEATWPGDAGTPCRVRLLTYLPGRPLHLATATPAQTRAIGRCLAKLDQGLAGFRHPADGHFLLWDIQHAAGLRGLAESIPDPQDRALALAVLDRFERHALPALSTLRRQVIHNDFNPHNILADPHHDDRIAGIIDFGDMVRAPLVQDLATAAAYRIHPEGHPLAGPRDLVAAFHATLPLAPEELDVLADLVATRLVTTIAISGWRARRQPANAAYILRNHANSIASLRRLATLPREAATNYLREGLDR